MRPVTFAEYVRLREGLMLPDRPPAPGLSRINVFPATQAQRRRLRARPPGAAGRRPGGIDYAAAVDHGVLP